MSNNKYPTSIEIKIAEKVRETCVKVAQEAFQDASMSGLCTEGAIEAAIGAMQSIDVKAIVVEAGKEGK